MADAFIQRFVAAAFALAVIVILALALTGCSSTPRVAEGDLYSTVAKNEGAPTWARTVDQEKWCEWFYDNRIHGGPWLVVAFDLVAWNDWVAACAARKALARFDEVEVAVTEPRAKWARYSLSWGLQGPHD